MVAVQEGGFQGVQRPWSWCILSGSFGCGLPGDCSRSQSVHSSSDGEEEASSVGVITEHRS